MDQWCGDPRKPLPGDNAPTAKNAACSEYIRRQLRRILASEQFRHSLRLKHFLHFVVEMMLAGNSASIKAYTIAVDALGRDAGFDPQRDPIVRVEAARLRQALACYYAKAGRDDTLVIDLPRGTYVPVVRWATTQPTIRRPPGAGSAETPLAEAWRRRLAAHRHSALLQERLSRELGEQIRSLRGTLEESKALLRRQSGFAIAAGAAPLVAKVALAAAAEKPAAASAGAVSYPESGARRTHCTLIGDDPPTSGSDFFHVTGYGLRTASGWGPEGGQEIRQADDQPAHRCADGRLCDCDLRPDREPDCSICGGSRTG